MPVKNTHEGFLDRVEERYGNEYTVLGIYESVHKPIKLKHNTCGNIWETTAPYDFLKHRPNTCPKCSHPSRRKTNEQFVKEVFEKVGNEYTFLEEYVTTNKKLKVIHNICKHVYYITPNLFLNHGCRCPECNKNLKESKGVKEISKILKDLKISFLREVPIDEDGKRPDQRLKVDFYIPKYNLVIEFDGRQHFEERRFGKEEFQKTIERDKRKDKFLKDNDYSLIRIPYFTKIEKMLKHELRILKIIS